MEGINEPPERKSSFNEEREDVAWSTLRTIAAWHGSHEMVEEEEEERRRSELLSAPSFICKTVLWLSKASFNALQVRRRDALKSLFVTHG